MSRRQRCHNCDRYALSRNAFGWCDTCLNEERYGTADTCLWCGEESTADNRTYASVAEPPVSGYTAVEAQYHDTCLSASAKAMVR